MDKPKDTYIEMLKELKTKYQNCYDLVQKLIDEKHNDLTEEKVNMFTEIDKLPFGKEPNIKTKPTEEEVLKELEKYYSIVSNDDYYLTLINEFDQRVDIDKKCKRYECYHHSDCYADKKMYSSPIDFETHQLLTKLFMVWGWFDE